MKNFKEKLSSLLFLELLPEKASNLFKVNIGKDFYVPVNPEFLVNKINEGDSLKDIPVSQFIIGMAYALGADDDFRYNETYISIIRNFKDGDKIIKAHIAKLIRDNKKEDAFILLLGLNKILGEEEIENLLLSLGEELSLKDSTLKDNVLFLAEEAIRNGNKNGNLIKGSILISLNKKREGLVYLREYLAQGGDKSKELLTLMEEVERKENLDEAFDLVHKEPSKALEILLKYYKLEADNPTLIYNIAKANRELKNYEKAIYYLNEALALDSGYLDVLNELGINYSLLDNYSMAKEYFKRVYDTTKDLAPMTNLIIAYYMTGEDKEGDYLLDKAKVIAPDDEIIQTIEKMYKKNQ